MFSAWVGFDPTTFTERITYHVALHVCYTLCVFFISLCVCYSGDLVAGLITRVETEVTLSEAPITWIKNYTNS